MTSPNFSFYENDSTLVGGGTVINAGNVINFGRVSKGFTGTPTDSGKSPIHLWNDKGGVLGSDTATGIQISFMPDDGDTTKQILQGTISNGFLPMLQARSSGAAGSNITDDAQSAWTPIGPTNLLNIGNMPSNTRRSIHIRLAVPFDADPVELDDFLLQINFS